MQPLEYHTPPPPRFKVIANRFKSGTKEYSGRSVVSHSAFYLRPDANLMYGVVGGVLGGAIGGAIAGLAASMIKGGKQVMEHELADLPAEITEDPSWPLGTKGRVIVIPRGAVKRLTYPWWGALGIETRFQRSFSCEKRC